MNAKRLIALLVAVLMLVCMFSACGSKDDAKTDDKGSSSSSDTKKEDKKEDKKDDKKDDAPEETDGLYDFSWLGHGELDSTSRPLTIQAMLDGEYESTNQFFAVMKDVYKINYSLQVVPVEIYTNTLNSLASTGELPNSFITRNTQGGYSLDDITIVQWIEQGMLLSCNETIKHSTGNMQKFFGEEDGCMRWAYAWAQYVDGDWYCVTQANDTAWSMDIVEADGKLRLPVQIHGIYNIMYRQNWLDDFGLAMPTNPDEFYQTTKTIHDGDANGNGLTDERAFFCLGSVYQYIGPGAWYGLPYQDFIEDPSTMEIEVACLCDGYVDWATYMNKLYNDNLQQVGDGSHPWGFGSAFAEDNVIAWHCMSDNVRASGVSVLGEGTDYEPMPIVVLDGYTPRCLCQEAAAASFTFSATADTDPAAFAAYVDFLYSQELYMLSYYGVEGESWQWNDDGTITSWGGRTVTDNSKTVDDQFKALHNTVDWTGIAPIPQNGDCWPVDGGKYASLADAVAADAGYTENGYTRESWMAAQNWYTDNPTVINLNNVNAIGEENLNWQSYYTMLCLPTADQSTVLQTYGTDLKTYIQEMSTKLVTGDYTVDMVDDLIAAAMDTYHLQEYMDVLNENGARFLDALKG